MSNKFARVKQGQLTTSMSRSQLLVDAPVVVGLDGIGNVRQVENRCWNGLTSLGGALKRLRFAGRILCFRWHENAGLWRDSDTCADGCFSPHGEAGDGVSFAVHGCN